MNGTRKSRIKERRATVVLLSVEASNWTIMNSASAMEEWQPKIVAAIDFGTCNTRMAFAEIPLTTRAIESDDVIVMNNWQYAPGAWMAPTSILFDHTRSVIGYGHEAEEKFRAMKPVERRSCSLFKNFKMDLHQKPVSQLVYNGSSVKFH